MTTMKLSERYAQLAHAVAQGLCDKDIAAKLGLSPGTIKVYMHKLLRKTGRTSRLEIALDVVHGRFQVPDENELLSAHLEGIGCPEGAD